MNKLTFNEVYNKTFHIYLFKKQNNKLSIENLIKLYNQINNSEIKKSTYYYFRVQLKTCLIILKTKYLNFEGINNEDFIEFIENSKCKTISINQLLKYVSFTKEELNILFSQNNLINLNNNWIDLNRINEVEKIDNSTQTDEEINFLEGQDNNIFLFINKYRKNKNLINLLIDFSVSEELLNILLKFKDEEEILLFILKYKNNDKVMQYIFYNFKDIEKIKQLLALEKSEQDS